MAAQSTIKLGVRYDINSPSEVTITWILDEWLEHEVCFYLDPAMIGSPPHRFYISNHRCILVSVDGKITPEITGEIMTSNFAMRSRALIPMFASIGFWYIDVPIAEYNEMKCVDIMG
jgi:hypothetical protein